LNICKKFGESSNGAPIRQRVREPVKAVVVVFETCPRKGISITGSSCDHPKAMVLQAEQERDA
ncbi:MAG TPA: hypothetical protein VE665_02620, partial [Hyphomicrobiaceae bacterium]|nr:hypothetical protein [Hyphomicrobiaceae bacterium]